MSPAELGTHRVGLRASPRESHSKSSLAMVIKEMTSEDDCWTPGDSKAGSDGEKNRAHPEHLGANRVQLG